jgi:hypothetical protein
VASWASIAVSSIQMPITCNIRWEWFINFRNTVLTVAAPRKNTNGPNRGRNTAEEIKARGSRIGTLPEPLHRNSSRQSPAFLFPKIKSGIYVEVKIPQKLLPKHFFIAASTLFPTKNAIVLTNSYVANPHLIFPRRWVQWNLQIGQQQTEEFTNLWKQ